MDPKNDGRISSLFWFKQSLFSGSTQFEWNIRWKITNRILSRGWLYVDHISTARKKAYLNEIWSLEHSKIMHKWRFSWNFSKKPWSWWSHLKIISNLFWIIGFLYTMELSDNNVNKMKSRRYMFCYVLSIPYGFDRPRVCIVVAFGLSGSGSPLQLANEVTLFLILRATHSTSHTQ